ncbi:CYtochrome P450 family [Caenorhabditis elegans]|uniref:CYtochrome P450 family n=1 Tax=Caenorhabditis elegans TaxID=6239 RepID=Q27507_CAEEL|nr:CYtochrome P450 family [Caenorhabditis elegans]CAA90617.1 CYtochrome P450 family [Caenorhabditis elegans]|eukprot:NP_510205.1 CYtochrome P450 family [Caenorhabditis elegans]
MSVFIIAFFTFITTYVAYFYWKVSKYPKGPLPLPFFGNLLQFPAENIHLYFDELSQTYGPCFTLWTPLPAVVLTDYDHVKEAFVTQGDAFINRANRPPETLLQPHLNTGVLGSSGDNWRLQRRTALKILRDFGLGRNLMEEQVMRSVQEMLAQLDHIPDKQNVDMYWPIQLCVGNVINESLFGYHYKYEDSDKFETFVKVINKHLKIAQGKPQLLVSAFPWLRYVPIIGELGYHKIQRNIQSYQKFIDEEVVSQIKQYDGESEPENFVHAYLQQMKQSGNPNLDMNNLCASVLDFWLAGMETTSNSLRWHLAAMMKYPEIQDKVRKEIFDNVGTARLPSMSDKPNMPYTQAVIHEVQRFSNMIPILGTHTNKEDILLKGKNVPTGTVIFAQIWSVLKNDSVFEDSHKFNPDRYLLTDGKTFDKTILERTIPFSVGKRNCVGEGLARMELFLIFTALIQKYEFIPNGSIDLSPVPGAVLTTKPYTCRLIPQSARKFQLF